MAAGEPEHHRRPCRDQGMEGRLVAVPEMVGDDPVRPVGDGGDVSAVAGSCGSPDLHRGTVPARARPKGGSTITDTSPARASAPARLGESTPVDSPISAAISKNGNDVDRSNPLATVARPLSTLWKASAGSPRTITSRPNTKGTSTSAEGSLTTSCRSSLRPLVTKKTGTRKPKPMASSLTGYAGCEPSGSGSITRTRPPVRKAPRT